MASVQQKRFSRIQPTFSPFFSHKSEIEIWTDLSLSLFHRVKVRCNDCIWEKRDMQMKVFRFERNRICQSAMRTKKMHFLRKQFCHTYVQYIRKNFIASVFQQTKAKQYLHFAHILVFFPLSLFAGKRRCFWKSRRTHTGTGTYGYSRRH